MSTPSAARKASILTSVGGLSAQHGPELLSNRTLRVHGLLDGLDQDGPAAHVSLGLDVGGQVRGLEQKGKCDNAVTLKRPVETTK